MYSKIIFCIVKSHYSVLDVRIITTVFCVSDFFYFYGTPVVFGFLTLLNIFSRFVIPSKEIGSRSQTDLVLNLGSTMEAVEKFGASVKEKILVNVS